MDNLLLHISEGLSYKEIARYFNVTPQNIRGVEKTALRKIKRIFELRDVKLNDYGGILS